MLHLVNEIWSIIITFTAIVAIALGFTISDRRSLGRIFRIDQDRGHGRCSSSQLSVLVYTPKWVLAVCCRQYPWYEAEVCKNALAILPTTRVSQIHAC